MAMDLSSLGILVKDEQGNLQEQKLGEVLALGGSNSPQPSLTLREGEQESKIQKFRQQLSKVTGETGYTIPNRHPELVSGSTTKGTGSRVGARDDGGTTPSPAPPSQTLPTTTYNLHPHYLTGPVQEIGSLSLDDLRHWNSKEQIVKHLTDEIGLLTKDSLAVRANGIRAWQKSPLHQLYLEIGRQSMVEDKPLGQVVAERIRAGKPTLTLEQFEALMEANEAMRY